MVRNIQAVTEGVARTIGWVSLQPDSSISVGLSDRTFISPRCHARQFVWNAYNRVSLQYRVPHSPEELVAVVNPHLSFHPPIYFHLRATNTRSCLLELRTLDHACPRRPHTLGPLCFGSVDQLAVSAAPRDPERTPFLAIPIDYAGVSVDLAIDFVRPEADSLVEAAAAEQFPACGRFRLHVRCEVLPGQAATMSWYHQY